jgi:hypothetical protein
MRVIRIVIVVFGLGSTGTLRPTDAADGAPPKPDSPTSAIQCLAEAYTDKSLDRYAALLSADYRFHFSSGQQLAHYADGFTREDELKVASNLFHGVVHDGRVTTPAAERIRVVAGGTSVGTDPEHPDSTAYYRTVVVRRFEMAIRLTNGDSIVPNPALHVFHVVRGDAALCAAGQPADSTRWYIRRWLEDVDGLTLALTAQKQDCGEPNPGPAAPAREEAASAPAPGPHRPVELAIHPLGNPACPSLTIQCDLPGSGPARLEVFDVMGRLMNHRDLDVTVPGTLSVEAGADAHLEPGVYWVRLTQARLTASTKMVVVTR